jgi:hypothetical protein
VFAVVAVFYFALLAANLWRVSVTKRPAPEQRAPFAEIGATSVVQAKVADAERPDSTDPGKGETSGQTA